ncbi:MAG: sialidase family protein [Phycisphaerae bacterium]|jgi:hypothetical protein
MKKCLLLIVCCTFSSLLMAAPDNCIEWLGSSERVIFQPVNGGAWYPRMLKLQNNRWLCAYDTRQWSETYPHIGISRSKDEGNEWEYAATASFGMGSAANGQLMQLPCGDVLCAYRLVLGETKTLKVSKSTDNGWNWTHLSTIISNTGGVWEPHIIRKDDGQLLVFYAQDENSGGYDQIIEMQRSDDNGATWHSPQFVSGATWSRDGMPVPEVLDNGDIFVVIEAHFNAGEVFSIASVRSTDGGDTWGPRTLVCDMNDLAAAPYVVQAPNGQLIASFQTDDVPEGYVNEMGITASFDGGRTWFQQPRPFSATSGPNFYWNSLMLQDEDTVVAVTSAGNIRMIKGRLKSPYNIPADLNDDGRVNLRDISELAAYWLFDCWGNTTAPACAFE